MKVLLINGSPRKNGNTHIALTEVAKTLETNDIQAEIVSIGTKAMQGCIACNKCRELGRCVFKDEVYDNIRENWRPLTELLSVLRSIMQVPTGHCVPCSTGYSIP